MSAVKWAHQRLTVNVSLPEKEKLDRMAKAQGRTITEIIRELIRNKEEGS